MARQDSGTLAHFVDVWGEGQPRMASEIEDFGDIVRAVAAEPRMMCLSAPTVVAQADRDALLPLLQGKALAGASEAVGEIAILD